MFSQSTRFCVALLRVLRNLGFLYLIGWYIELAKAPSAVIQFVFFSTILAWILLSRMKRWDMERGIMLLDVWLTKLGFKGEWLVVSPSWSDDIPQPSFLEASAKRILEAAMSMEMKVAVFTARNPLSHNGRVLILGVRPASPLNEEQLRQLSSTMKMVLWFNYRRLNDWVQTVRCIRNVIPDAGR